MCVGYCTNDSVGVNKCRVAALGIDTNTVHASLELGVGEVNGEGAAACHGSNRKNMKHM